MAAHSAISTRCFPGDDAITFRALDPVSGGFAAQSEIDSLVTGLRICSKSAARFLLKVAIAINANSPVATPLGYMFGAHLFLQGIYRC